MRFCLALAFVLWSAATLAQSPERCTTSGPLKTCERDFWHASTRFDSRAGAVVRMMLVMKETGPGARGAEGTLQSMRLFGTMVRTLAPDADSGKLFGELFDRAGAGNARPVTAGRFLWTASKTPRGNYVIIATER